MLLNSQLDTEVQEGAEPAGGTADEFAALIRRDLVKWEKVVKQSGARVD